MPVGFSNLFAELQGSSLRQHMPRASAVPFTTITMNKRYAARLHRDSRNDGPSIGNAVGKFSGGKLLYWRRFVLRNVRGSAGGSCKQEATSFHAESADHRDNVRQQTEDLWHLVKERAALEGTSVQGASRSFSELLYSVFYRDACQLSGELLNAAIERKTIGNLVADSGRLQQFPQTLRLRRAGFKNASWLT
jgi:hypothetical protein